MTRPHNYQPDPRRDVCVMAYDIELQTRPRPGWKWQPIGAAPYMCTVVCSCGYCLAVGVSDDDSDEGQMSCATEMARNVGYAWLRTGFRV